MKGFLKTIHLLKKKYFFLVTNFIMLSQRKFKNPYTCQPKSKDSRTFLLPYIGQHSRKAQTIQEKNKGAKQSPLNLNYTKSIKKNPIPASNINSLNEKHDFSQNESSIIGNKYEKHPNNQLFMSHQIEELQQILNKNMRYDQYYTTEDFQEEQDFENRIQKQRDLLKSKRTNIHENLIEKIMKKKLSRSKEENITISKRKNKIMQQNKSLPFKKPKSKKKSDNNDFNYKFPKKNSSISLNDQKKNQITSQSEYDLQQDFLKSNRLERKMNQLKNRISKRKTRIVEKDNNSQRQVTEHLGAVDAFDKIQNYLSNPRRKIQTENGSIQNQTLRRNQLLKKIKKIKLRVGDKSDNNQSFPLKSKSKSDKDPYFTYGLQNWQRCHLIPHPNKERNLQMQFKKTSYEDQVGHLGELQKRTDYSIEKYIKNQEYLTHLKIMKSDSLKKMQDQFQ